MLDVKDINVYYGAIHAVRNVSLEVNAGEIVSIIGANGAGKSTILKTLVGLLRSKTGEISFEGQNISHLSPAAIVRQGIALVPEGRRVFPRLSVEDNLLLGAYARKDGEVSQDIQRIYEMFPRLAERRKQNAGTLSGGEQQMLAIGRALMGQPKLLLLDGPSRGLAPLLVKSIFETIRAINQSGVTILIVEQNARAALKLATRGYVLELGRVVMEDTAAHLLANPSIQEAYLGA